MANLWGFPTDAPIQIPYGALLSAEEQARAARFHQPGDRHRYQVVRTVLRIILGQWLDYPPDRLRFAYGPKGKPYLQEPAVPLHFSVSHSGNQGLIAVAVEGLVGVDLEGISPKSSLLPLARRFFSPSESGWLQGLDSTQQTQGFYQLWTAKEAFLKATGQGVSGGLDQVVLAPDLSAYAQLPAPHSPSQWQLLSQPFAQTYWMAVAINTPQGITDGSVQPFTWGEL